MKFIKFYIISLALPLICYAQNHGKSLIFDDELMLAMYERLIAGREAIGLETSIAQSHEIKRQASEGAARLKLFLDGYADGSKKVCELMTMKEYVDFFYIYEFEAGQSKLLNCLRMFRFIFPAILVQSFKETLLLTSPTFLTTNNFTNLKTTGINARLPKLDFNFYNQKTKKNETKNSYEELINKIKSNVNESIAEENIMGFKFNDIAVGNIATIGLFYFIILDESKIDFRDYYRCFQDQNEDQKISNRKKYNSGWITLTDTEILLNCIGKKGWAQNSSTNEHEEEYGTSTVKHKISDEFSWYAFFEANEKLHAPWESLKIIIDLEKARQKN
jgi:hypothetical protein